MEITYQRTPAESHMVITGQMGDVGFEEEMLRNNEVPVLLGFYTTVYDGSLQFWYNITGKKSLRDFAEQEGVTTEHIRMVFEYISLAYRSLSEYLIGDENVFLSPDTVFMEKKKSVWQMFFIYCPMEHEGFAHQIREIVNFYVESTDKRQREVTDLLKTILEITKEEGFSLKEILDVLREDEERGTLSQPETFEENQTPLDEREDAFKKALREIDDSDAVVRKKGIGQLISDWFSSLKQRLHRKKEDLFPSDDEMVDLTFDPVEDFSEETSFLSESDLHCSGKLLYEGGGNGEQDFMISHTPFRIGSKAGKNDAVLHSGVVSRCHAKIIKENDVYYLVDLNSRNGTYINDRLLPYHEAAPLKPMDMISFADVTYRVV